VAHERPHAEGGEERRVGVTTASALPEPVGALVSEPLQVATALRLQRTAGNAAVARLATASNNSPRARVLARHPAEKVLKFAGRWLTKRAFKQVSKHIAKHGRNIAGKALHSVFKSPKDIRWLIERTVSEAEQVAARQSKKAAGEVIEEAGIKIERQAVGSGKWRLKVQKAFGSAIGTKGETVLRVIIDQSGRIVTAFPAERIAAIGIGVAGALALEEGTAQAAEQVRTDAEAQARKAAEKEDSWGDWQEWIPFIGDVWGGSLNEGEDEYLRQQRFYAAVVEDVIARVEHEEQRTIGASQREELGNLIRAGIAAPYMVDDDGAAPQDASAPEEASAP
jgi:hypothetical protein